MSQKQENVFIGNISSFIHMNTVLLMVFLLGSQLTVSLAEAQDADVSQADLNTRPVGKVRMTGEELPVEEVEAVEEAAPEPEPEVAIEPVNPGKQVYGSLCFSCHGTNLPGIPQLGDKAAWVDRIAQGNGVLYERALTGYTGASGIPMPPKGGNMALSDDEVKAAVDYMVASAE